MADPKASNLYRVPIRELGPGRRSKARVDYQVRHFADGRHGMVQKLVPAPGARVVEIRAPSSAAAERLLVATVAPQDPRPILGISNVSLFRVDEQEPSRVQPS